MNIPHTSTINPTSPKWHSVVHPSWHRILDPVSDRIDHMGEFLRNEIAQERFYVPAGNKVFAAFQQPSDQVKVLIVGQDPYPTPGHAMGLSFSVEPDTRPFPKSLLNIFSEYSSDLGYATPRTGDLSPWSAQGVFLLNRVLTTQVFSPAAHQNRGWEEITAQAIRGLIAQERPLVAILWGKQAATLKPLLLAGGEKVKIIESVHPSPLSAHRGFFGSRPFSQTNAYLEELGMPVVNWKLP